MEINKIGGFINLFNALPELIGYLFGFVMVQEECCSFDTSSAIPTK